MSFLLTLIGILGLLTQTGGQFVGVFLGLFFLFFFLFAGRS